MITILSIDRLKYEDFFLKENNTTTIDWASNSQDFNLIKNT